MTDRQHPIYPIRPTVSYGYTRGEGAAGNQVRRDAGQAGSAFCFELDLVLSNNPTANCDSRGGDKGRVGGEKDQGDFDIFHMSYPLALSAIHLYRHRAYSNFLTGRNAWYGHRVTLSNTSLSTGREEIASRRKVACTTTLTFFSYALSRTLGLLR